MPMRHINVVAVGLAISSGLVASCSKHTTVLGHCELPNITSRSCWDWYAHESDGKKACEIALGAASDAETKKTRWVEGAACDRSGAAAGCARGDGERVEWFYPGPGRTDQQSKAVAQQLCTGHGDTVVGTDWQPK